MTFSQINNLIWGFYMGYLVSLRGSLRAPILWAQGVESGGGGVNCFVSTIPCSRYPIQAYS